jgi:catechol 2,3-dioxygenase-like lactoylglutathione lyase family enzyme
MKISRVIETALYCENVPEMVSFYQNLFDFPLLMEASDRGAFLGCGDSILIIFNRNLTTLESQRVPSHGSTGPGHTALEIDNGSINLWKQHLTEKGISIEKEVNWEHTKATSIYFRDPANNSIELAEKSLWNK